MNIGESLGKVLWGTILAGIGLVFMSKGYKTIGAVEGSLDTYDDLVNNKGGKLTDLANQAGYRLIEK